jgi:hypothetical protein
MKTNENNATLIGTQAFSFHFITPSHISYIWRISFLTRSGNKIKEEE